MHAVENILYMGLCSSVQGFMVLVKTTVPEFQSIALLSQNSRDIFFSANGDRTGTVVLTSAGFISMYILKLKLDDPLSSLCHQGFLSFFVCTPDLFPYIGSGAKSSLFHIHSHTSHSIGQTSSNLTINLSGEGGNTGNTVKSKKH